MRSQWVNGAADRAYVAPGGDAKDCQHSKGDARIETHIGVAAAAAFCSKNCWTMSQPPTRDSKHVKMKPKGSDVREISGDCRKRIDKDAPIIIQIAKDRAHEDVDCECHSSGRMAFVLN
jgi:hypothetical protein